MCGMYVCIYIYLFFDGSVYMIPLLVASLVSERCGSIPGPTRCSSAAVL